ncbi:hypothetical protein Syun_011927 [Stephania yunnanensis]|uniref:Uncharacterized protein n=1 Tax=Stephania yunnanensis TaxID=152371 RepID=A0AAP0JYJ5_9MAGN
MMKFNHYNPNEYVVRDGETGEGINLIWDRELNRSIPIELGKLTYMFYLNVANNNLEGPIPDNLSSCTNLNNLNTVNGAHYAEENCLEQICLKRYDYFGLLYAGVVTVEGITDVLEVPASLLVEGIIIFFDSGETVNAYTSKSIKFDEFSIVEEYLSEPEETLEVSLHEPDITIAQYDDDEAEKEIEVISERPEKPQKENEEDQPLVLVKPPTLQCIFVRIYKGVEVKERSWIFYTTDTFVLDDRDSTDSFVLEVPNELRTLKEGMHVTLPKAIDAPFIVDISKGEGIT